MIVCRFGGDEFLIVLKDVADESSAIETVKAIKNRINKISLEPIEEIWCSVGLCFVNEINGLSSEEIISRADNALYEAKQKGKNSYHLV